MYAAQVRWVGEVEDSGVAAELSCSSTRVLLRDVLRISSGDAADRVRAAKLTQQREPISGGEIPPQLPIVGAALDAGDIGQAHVAVITKAFTGWPRTVDQDTADQVEQLLVDQAQEIDPGQLNKVAQRLDDIMNPDGHAPDERDPHQEPNSGSAPGTPTPGSPPSPAPSPTKAWRSSGKPPSPSRNRSRTTTAFGIRGHRRTGSPKHTSTCSAPIWTQDRDPASVGTSRTSR